MRLVDETKKIWTIVLGIIGSIIGGAVTHMFSRPTNERYHPAGLAFSTLGAILVLFICYVRLALGLEQAVTRVFGDTKRPPALEERLGPPVETEFSRRLSERLAAGRRRLAELGGEPVEVRPRENLRRPTPVARPLMRAHREASPGLLQPFPSHPRWLCSPP